jgi:hypothetical protein
VNKTRVFVSNTFFALLIAVSQPALAGESPSIKVVEPVHLYKSSMVANNSLMQDSSAAEPIFRLEKAVVPNGWDVLYMGDEYASLNVRWSKGDKWTTVFDRFAKLHNINVIVDGGKKSVLVGPAGNIRSSGLILTTSLSPVAERRYHLKAAYSAVKSANHDRLMQLAEEEKRQKLLTLAKKSQRNSVNANESVVKVNPIFKENDALKQVYTDETINSASVEEAQEVQEVQPLEFSFAMERGFLKEQVARLITKLRDVDGINKKLPATMIWLSDENIKWPNEYVITGKSELHVLNAIMSSYNLYARMKKNNIIVITEGK